jgi:AcrR family transcriptional regulator
MSRAQPLPPDERRAQLLAAARQVFSARGYHAASVSDVLVEAGVARGTFYNHFESKRAVFGAVLEEMMEEVAASARPIDIGQPIPPQVQQNLLRIIQTAQRRDIARLLFLEGAVVDEEGEQALREFWDRALARISRALRTGQDLGWVRGTDPELAARCVLGLVKEPLFQAGLRKEEVQAEALADELLTWLMGGLLR